MAAANTFPRLPSDWTEETLVINSGQIFMRIYHAPKFDQGRLLYIVHGQGEQSDRYEHFPFYLSGIVDAIVCIDLPGHGKSTGIRGHIENFDQYDQAALDGFLAAQDWMRKKATRFQSHWLGHSMGGLITLRTLFKNSDLQISSVIASAPLLGLALPVPPLKKFFAELFEPLIGSVKLSNELDGSLISHDPAVGSYYQENPLNHGFVTPRFFKNLMKEMPLVQKNQGPFSYPLLLISPLADPIVSSKDGVAFFKELKMKDGNKKSLVTFPNFFHESFNELEKGRAFNALVDWLGSFK